MSPNIYIVAGPNGVGEVDAWILFDNSGLEPTPIAEQEQDEIRIIDPDTYKLLTEQNGQPE